MNVPLISSFYLQLFPLYWWFSDEFIDYIHRQLTDDDKHGEDSKGRNIFKLYPQFRHHIGIEII